jgi:hypothetical protein
MAMEHSALCAPPHSLGSFQGYLPFVLECLCLRRLSRVIPNWSPHVHTVSRGTCRKILVGVAIYRRSLRTFTSFCGPRFLKSEATLFSGIDEKKVGERSTLSRSLRFITIPAPQMILRSLRQTSTIHRLSLLVCWLLPLLSLLRLSLTY